MVIHSIPWPVIALSRPWPMRHYRGPPGGSGKGFSALTDSSRKRHIPSIAGSCHVLFACDIPKGVNLRVTEQEETTWVPDDSHVWVDVLWFFHSTWDNCCSFSLTVESGTLVTWCQRHTDHKRLCVLKGITYTVMTWGHVWFIECWLPLPVFIRAWKWLFEKGAEVWKIK